MIRLRFNDINQLFENDADQIVLPLSQIDEAVSEKFRGRLIAEIPSIIWENDIAKVKEKLKEIKAFGVSDVLVENTGAIHLAKEFDFSVHGGMTLNCLNSIALSEYEKLGLCDMTMSFELAFSKLAKIKHNIPIGFVAYGYLPLMKMRACPVKGEKGCGNCDGRRMLTDRMGEQFTVLCHEKKYSELLNCVPLYVADKTIPKLDFQTLYFTKETASQAEEIYNLYIAKETPSGRRTAGLYFRELL